ncbi:MAG: T9SS type A sorting domain-containing protein, partial [Saprospiraceae bacterium]
PFTLVYNDGGGNTTLNNYTSNQTISLAPGATTTYQLVQVMDALGCSATPIGASATLVVHPYPTLAHVLSPVNAVCAGAPVSFFADGLIPNTLTTFNYTVNGQAVNATATTDASGNVTFPPAVYPAGTNNILVTAVTAHGCTTTTNLGTSFLINPQSAGCNLSVGGKAANEAGTGLEEVEVSLSGSGPGIPAFGLNNLTTGTYSFLNMIPPTANIVITPAKNDNPLNGVSTYDLVLISRHILGLDSLGSLYRMIAADATNSGSITTFDIVELRKLILGIYQKLPNNSSWRFMDASYVFPNPANPFTGPLPETRTVNNILTDHLQEDFVAVKIGDVNGSALANATAPAEERSTGSLVFELADRFLRAGESCTVRFRAAEKVLGYQFTLRFDGLQLLNVLPGPQMTLENFGLFPEALTTSFFGDQAGAFTLTFRALADGKLSDRIGVSSAITPAEAYGLQDDRLAVAIHFEQNLEPTVQGFELYQNQPNPFADRTVIAFYLPEAAATTLQVFDEMGRLRWSQSADLPTGNNSIEVDGAVLDAAGTFYYQVKTATDMAVRKMNCTR